MFDAFNSPTWAARTDLNCKPPTGADNKQHQTHADQWYPDREAVENRTAATLCAGCPAILDCGTWALENAEEWGIFGGMTAGDRRRILATGSTTPQPRPVPDIDPDTAARASCGTTRGYRAHHRNNEPACGPCADAEATRSYERREKKKQAVA